MIKDVDTSEKFIVGTTIGNIFLFMSKAFLNKSVFFITLGTFEHFLIVAMFSVHVILQITF